jgi:hypothetical protein
MTKRLLVEYFPISYSAVELNEAIKNNGLVSFKAILQRANAKNQNGRVYPYEILMRESQKYSNEFVKERRALGELDHPENRTVVNLANVSHNISEMHWEGDDLIGTIEVLNTPSGNIVKELMRNGIKIGVSSRGVGSVRELGENTVEVEDDFGLICFDIVSNPSTQGAFLSEGINNSIRDNKRKRVHALVSDFLSEVGK